MPLEMHAIVRAFGLQPTSSDELEPWVGRVGGSEVTAVHIGMGPPLTRAALERLFDASTNSGEPIDHVMNAGICGGLDPDIAVGTLINPAIIVDNATGAQFRHRPPGDAVLAGKLMTMEAATLDPERSRRFLAEGFLAVDMESAAVAAVCEEHDCPWSIYRCIGDRYFDGLLDERLIAATNPDGSGNMAEIARLIDADPLISAKLDRLQRDTSHAARLAAEAAARGCLALDD
jgi:nucleoside phosphorylase